jgi:exodeoxyribonuclease VII large subunit
MLRSLEICVNYPDTQIRGAQSLMSPEPNNQAPSGASPDEIYTVGRLNREARRLLEGSLRRVWVAGEISNLARPASGHIYFTLKDDQAQVRCAMFRAANRRLSSPPEDGNQVLVRAKVSIYEPRGDYQLIVEELEQAGEGILRRKFEELKKRLGAEGLFDAEHKQAVPQLPGRIGVVTSPTGAAIRDILNILKRRYPGARVIVYPTRVQGEGSADEIVKAINTAASRRECDVLIISRGGGSLEDLWSFNEEAVARAIYACTLPTVAGIGHEVDVTIADLVADVRAPTPSGAAELVVPDCDELMRTLGGLERRALLSVRRLIADRQQHFANVAGRLQRLHPGAVLDQLRQRLDQTVADLAGAATELLEIRYARHAQLRLRLRSAAPAHRLERLGDRLATHRRMLAREIRSVLADAAGLSAAAAAKLNAVSPLATLERGYAIVTDTDTGALLRDAGRLRPGDRISARLAQGEIDARVEKVRKKPS